MTKWPNDQMTKWTNEQMNKWPNDQMDKWTNEQMLSLSAIKILSGLLAEFLFNKYFKKMN